MRTGYPLFRVLAAGGLLLVVAGLCSNHITRRVLGETPAAPAKAAEPTATLGGPDRYLTSVSTDKPIYRISETIFVRAVLLHHETRKPFAGGTHAVVEIKGPKGDITLNDDYSTFNQEINRAKGLKVGSKATVQYKTLSGINYAVEIHQ